MIMIYLHGYTIYIYNKVRKDSNDAQGGGSFFFGINRRPGDRGKNADRGGEGRGGYPLVY